jgi:hypothetical protein
VPARARQENSCTGEKNTADVLVFVGNYNEMRRRKSITYIFLKIKMSAFLRNMFRQYLQREVKYFQKC